MNNNLNNDNVTENDSELGHTTSIIKANAIVNKSYSIKLRMR